MKKHDHIIKIVDACSIDRATTSSKIGETEIWVTQLTLLSMGKKQGTAIIHGSEDQTTKHQLYASSIGKSLFPYAELDKAVVQIREEMKARLENGVVRSRQMAEQYGGSYIAEAEAMQRALDARAWETVPVVDKTQEWLENGWSVI